MGTLQSSDWRGFGFPATDYSKKKTILLIKYKINETVCNFLNKALQLDEDYLFAEQKAEAIGILN